MCSIEVKQPLEKLTDRKVFQLSRFYPVGISPPKAFSGSEKNHFLLIASIL